MRNKHFLSGMVLLGALMLGGCLEDFQVTLHEAHVYKGPADDLVEKGSQSATLSERFNTGQIDR